MTGAMLTVTIETGTYLPVWLNNLGTKVDYVFRDEQALLLNKSSDVSGFSIVLTPRGRVGLMQARDPFAEVQQP